VYVYDPPGVTLAVLHTRENIKDLQKPKQKLR